MIFCTNVAQEMFDRGMTVMGKHMTCFQERIKQLALCVCV